MSPDTNRSQSPFTPDGKLRTACEFCHRRKTRCDLKQPTCSNCEHAKRECKPVNREVRQRPTREIVARLEDDLHHCQQLLRYLCRATDSQRELALKQWTISGNGRIDFRSLESGTSTTQSDPGANSLLHDILGGSQLNMEIDTPQVEPVTDAANSQVIPVEGNMTVSAYSVDNQAGSGSNKFRYDNNGHTSTHGPTSAFFDDPEMYPYLATHNSLTAQQAQTEDDMRSRLTAECAEQRGMEILNVASGKLDFDGVDPELAMHLLGLHWNRQHFAFLITYRPLFTRDMACGGPYFSKLLLNAILFSVSKFSNRIETYDDPADQSTAGLRFLRRCKDLLGCALDQSTLPTIQAMLLLSSSLFALGFQSSPWLYNGIAIRMIFDMGLQHDLMISSTLKAEDLEIRRRVVWAAFVSDKIISLYQGRAVSFQESDMHVPNRFLDRYEELELWTPFAFGSNLRYPGAPARALSTFTALCSLSVIMGRIISHIYAERTKDRPERHLATLAHSLDRWEKDLPDEIRFDAADPTSLVPPPHVMSLHAVHDTLVILLHRPFVESGHLHLSDSSTVASSWAKCEKAAASATTVLMRYREAFGLARAPYLISYTIYVAATIHVRNVAQRGVQSDAGNLLSVCLEALRENSLTNTGVSKMYDVIRGLMRKLGVVFPVELRSQQEQTQQVNPLDVNLDLAAIIRSFDFDPTALSSTASMAMVSNNQPEPIHPFDWPGPTDQALQPDSLYGIFGFDFDGLI